MHSKYEIGIVTRCKLLFFPNYTAKLFSGMLLVLVNF